MMNARRALMMLVALGLAAACAGDDEVTTGPGDGPSPGGGDSGLFVSIEVGGGFVPIGHDFRSLPQAVVYEDGTTLSPGAVVAVYPGPAVLPVSEGQLTAGELQQILEGAREAGIVDGGHRDFGEPPIADAPTTSVTVVVDGEDHSLSVYALSEAGADLPGLDAEAAEARADVQSFVELVSRLVTEGERAEHEPDRYRVLPLEPQPAGDGGIEPEVVDWPLPDVELARRACVVIDGEEADLLREALDDATEITRWRTPSGETFSLAVGPVLPHEEGCP